MDATPTPSRRFGQNFLADRRAAQRLVELFAPGPDDRVVEIGPGTGALTALLAPHAGRLVALELDRRLVPALEQLLLPFPNAQVRTADALETDWDALGAELGGPLRVIGNLPYNVGTAIVRRVLGAHRVHDLQVVLQLEVAERILAPPGPKSYGPLSVVAALRARRERLLTLPPGAFRPRPKVTSAALRLTFRDDALLAPDEIPALERWLFAGFGHRRKTLAGNLGPRRDEVRAFLAAAGLPEDARAETLAPELWLDLARRLDRP